MAKQFEGISEQRKAAIHRLDDAQALLDKQRWRGSMYMAGYVIECLLKSKLMEIYGLSTLSELEPELQRRGILGDQASIYTHRLENLLRSTGGWDRMNDNLSVKEAFSNTNAWVPAWRYNPDLSDLTEAEDFLEDVKIVREWIKNNI